MTPGLHHSKEVYALETRVPCSTGDPAKQLETSDRRNCHRKTSGTWRPLSTAHYLHTDKIFSGHFALLSTITSFHRTFPVSSVRSPHIHWTLCQLAGKR